MNILINTWDKLIGQISTLVYHSPVRGKNRIIRMLLHLSMGQRVRSVYGMWLKKNWNDATFNFSVIGNYGNDLCDVISAINENTVFLDIGSNTGLFSFVAENNPDVKQCLAFEPNPYVYNYLEENKKLNNSEIEILNFGIGESNTDSVLVFDPSHSGKGKISKTEKNGTNVKLRNYQYFDTVASKYPASRFFCKIDVEGYEAIVVKEIQKSTIRNRLSAVFVEIDERRLSEEEINEIIIILSGCGLKIKKKYGSGVHYDLLFTSS